MGPVASFLFLAVLAVALFILGRFLSRLPVPLLNSLLKWACYIGGVLLGLLALYIGITEGITALLGWVTNHTGTTITIIFVGMCVFAALTKTTIKFGGSGDAQKKKEEALRRTQENLYRDKSGVVHTNAARRDIANKRYDETH